jgi:VWFA-related protein
LVQVDVLVKAKDIPVSGLTRDDFELFDNGKPQQISVFSVRDMAATNPPKQHLPEGVFSNRPTYRGPEPVTATVILFDSLNTAVADQGYVRLQALKYLAKTSRNEVIALYQMDTTVKVLLPFTDDRDKIRQAVERFNMVQSQALQDGEDGLLAGLNDNSAQAARLFNLQRRIDITTAVFNGLAQHLKGLPGRKKLVWITEGVMPTVTQQTTRNGVTMNDYYNFSEKLYAPAKTLNDANIAVYAVNPAGPKLDYADPNLTSMLYFAQKTGGKAVYGGNDVAGDIEAAITDTDLTYTLGFYSTEETSKAHNLQVKVKRSGVDVRYRANYSTTEQKPVTATVRTGTLNATMHEPLEFTDIAIFASATPANSHPGYFDVAVKIDINDFKLEEKNGRFKGSFDLAIAPDVESHQIGLRQTITLDFTQQRLVVALNEGVNVVDRIRATDSEGKLLSKRLHVAVMDNNSLKTGSVRIPIEPKK